jgi:hypothetical protein
LKPGGETGQTRNAPEGLCAPKDASLTILNWNTTGVPPAGQASPQIADGKRLPA